MGLPDERNVGPPRTSLVSTNHHPGNNQHTLGGGIIAKTERAKAHQPGSRVSQGIIDLGLGGNLSPGLCGLRETI